MRSAILNLNKPAGLSSQQAVSRVKRILGLKKAGHCGTLDPEATGVLLLCTGRATRLADYFQALAKTYRTVLRLGETTDTQDATGTVLEQSDTSRLTVDRVLETLAGFTGDIRQLPPMYSALKKDGVPLYRLARKGQSVERKPRTVQIHEIVAEAVDLPEVRFSVRCSRGTYIRTLCEDIGNRLGVGGHMHRLERTAIGRFRVEEAASLDQLEDRHLIDPSEALDFMKNCRVPVPAQKALANGRPVDFSVDFFDILPAEEERFRIETDGGLFLGVGVLRDEKIRVERLIADPRESTGHSVAAL